MTLDETIAHVLKLDLESTPGPWGYSTCYGVATIEPKSSTDGIAYAVDYLTPNNADLISEYRSLCPKLARALRTAVAALDTIATDFNFTVAQYALQQIQKEFES